MTTEFLSLKPSDIIKTFLKDISSIGSFVLELENGYTKKNKNLYYFIHSVCGDEISEVTETEDIIEECEGLGEEGCVDDVEDCELYANSSAFAAANNTVDIGKLEIDLQRYEY